ncbi:FecR family protein [uncultured Gimesia sp.]|uniref:FecR family protein n=1 Tax=uncultured Gimesia sp. TaxID=1678688 RepID=UPI00263496EC|nr:FecR family protein [uncultured Gimesia sp.]
MSDTNQKNEEEFERLLSRMADGPLDKAEVETLESLLLDQPERQALYLENMWLDSSLIELGGVSKSAPELNFARPRQKYSLPFSVLALTACAMICLVAAVLFVLPVLEQRKQFAEKETAEENQPSKTVESTTARNTQQEVLSEARFIAGHHTVFRGSISPMLIGSRLRFSEYYMLQEGLIKILFPSGAEVILSAPAQFQVVKNDELIVNLGKCSVYAPEGAEGFEVTTPTSEVVDLGTRFSVVVAEDGSSNVAVVEGEAEVTPLSNSHKRTLLKGDSAYVGTDLALVEGANHSQGDAYVATIPDRLITYESSLDDQGRAIALSSLSVQRGGVSRTYHSGDFILPSVNHFQSAATVFGVVPADSPPEEYNQFGPMNLLFASGFINPGGQQDLHAGDFVLGKDGTPGMNIVFDQPIINSPGPDMIIFDAQSIAHSLEGDAFHLYPQTDYSDALPVTIRKYDINGYSADAQFMTGCRLTHLSSAFADNGTPLPKFGRSQLVNKVPSRLFAIGVDLDDMQIPPGASITGLFLQDAQDDKDYIDPVVIIGLPPVK